MKKKILKYFFLGGPLLLLLAFFCFSLKEPKKNHLPLGLRNTGKDISFSGYTVHREPIKIECRQSRQRSENEIALDILTFYYYQKNGTLKIVAPQGLFNPHTHNLKLHGPIHLTQKGLFYLVTQTALINGKKGTARTLTPVSGTYGKKGSTIQAGSMQILENQTVKFLGGVRLVFH